MSQKLKRKFAPYRVTPIPKRAPKRPAAPKHEEQIKEQLVPPQLPPKREHQSKQDEASEQSAASVPDFPHNAQAWSAWLICVKKELDDVCRLLPDEDENAFDWLRTASTTLESAAIYAKCRSLQVSQKLQRKFAPYRIPKRAPKRPAAPKHEEQIEEQLVPPQLPPKRRRFGSASALVETFRYHLRGVCISGSACRFAHCETELRTTSKVSSPGFLLWKTGLIVADGWRQCFAKRGNSSKD